MTDYSIFFIIAVVATGVGALLFLLSLFGLGEHDLDFDADSGGADVGLLSIKSGIGFFLGFGWGGVLAQGLDWGMAASLAAAFFTGVLMFLIIGIWGGKDRIYASFKFFLYTLLGSLLMLVALIYLYNQSSGSFDIATWHQLPLSRTAQTLLFFA